MTAPALSAEESLIMRFPLTPTVIVLLDVAPSAHLSADLVIVFPLRSRTPILIMLRYSVISTLAVNFTLKLSVATALFSASKVATSVASAALPSVASTAGIAAKTTNATARTAIAARSFLEVLAPPPGEVHFRFHFYSSGLAPRIRTTHPILSGACPHDANRSIRFRIIASHNQRSNPVFVKHTTSQHRTS